MFNFSLLKYVAKKLTILKEESTRPYAPPCTFTDTF